MITLPFDSNQRNADFIDCVASVTHVVDLEYAKRRKLYVDEFDKRVETLVDDLYARLNALAGEIAGEFDVLLTERRQHLG